MQAFPTTKLTSQRHLFPEKAVAGYLNGASRAPQLKAVEAAAKHALWWRTENNSMPISEFFGPVEEIKRQFAQLINAPDPERVAMLPATSYGISTVAKNVPLSQGQNIIVVEDQFPSNYYPWQVVCADAGAELRTVAKPNPGSSGTWNERVLEAIDGQTAAVAIANIHWADGTLYDLLALRQRTNDVGAWLVIDGTQSIGAMPFDVTTVNPDALLVGGYKWLMGPYGCAYGWFGPLMDGGRPLEENWINRQGSEDFRNLVNYTTEYRPLANRYCVGQHSNFIMAPMQIAALQQVNAWAQEDVQEYCAGLWSVIEDELEALGVVIPEERAHHLVGLRLPRDMDREKLVAAINRRGLAVSYRGDAIRVSPHAYNTPEEMAELVGALRA
ncbi:MAG: aminotransferase class V-fold PLP-dependent enzyme, partial [Bacteroidota bacterium]